MRVYLAKFEIYEDIYGDDLCDPHYGSEVFIDFNRAHKYVKNEIDRWLKENGFKNKKGNKDKNELSGEFSIIERDTEDEDLEIYWEFDFDGFCIERLVMDFAGWDDRPGDELPGAGTKFNEGDFVIIKKKIHAKKYILNDRNKLYIVGAQPGKRTEPRPVTEGAVNFNVRWENHYRLEYLDEQGYFGHDHVHESELELYTGEVPLNYQILRKIFMGEVKITLKRLKDFFGDFITEDATIQEYIIKELTDDSTETDDLIYHLLSMGKIILPPKPLYREIT